MNPKISKEELKNILSTSEEPTSSVDAVLNGLSESELCDLINSVGVKSQETNIESMSLFSENADLIEAINQLKNYAKSFNNPKSSTAAPFSDKMLPYLENNLDLAIKKVIDDLGKIQAEQSLLKLKIESIKKDVETLSDIEKLVKTEETMFQLKRRDLDLKQTLQISLQGVMAFEVLINNSEALLKAARHAKNVTLPALKVAFNLNAAATSQSLIHSSLQELETETHDLLKYKPKSSREEPNQVVLEGNPFWYMSETEDSSTKDAYTFTDGSKIIELLDLKSVKEEIAYSGMICTEWVRKFGKPKDETNPRSLRVFSFVNQQGVKRFNFEVRGRDIGNAYQYGSFGLSQENFPYLKEFAENSGFTLSEDIRKGNAHAYFTLVVLTSVLFYALFF